MAGPRRATSPSCILQHPGIFPGGRTAWTDPPAVYQLDDCPALGSYSVWVLCPLPRNLGNSHDRGKPSALGPHPSCALSRLCDLEGAPSLCRTRTQLLGSPPGSSRALLLRPPLHSAEPVLHQSGLGRRDFDNPPQVIPLSPKPADHPGASAAPG